MKQTILAAALLGISTTASADAYVSTYMTTECGLRGFMAFKLVQIYQLGKEAVDEAPEYASIVDLESIPTETALWVKAVATSKSTQTSVMYPGFAAWYNHVGQQGVEDWVRMVVTKYDSPVEASMKERLACEKHYAGETE